MDNSIRINSKNVDDGSASIEERIFKDMGKALILQRDADSGSAEDGMFDGSMVNAEKEIESESAYIKLVDEEFARLREARMKKDWTLMKHAVSKSCRIAAKITSVCKNRKLAEEIILGLMVTPGIVRFCYGPLAETCIGVFKDEESAKAIFVDAYGKIVQDIEGSIIRKADRSEVENFCAELISLGFIFYGHFDDSKWLEKIADTAAGYAENFNNNLRTAELYLRQKLSRGKAERCLKKAYSSISSTWEYSQLADMVGNLLKDRVWGRALIKETEQQCKSSLDYCILGEIVSHPGGFNDRAEGARYFRISLEKAENERRRDDVLDSIENCLEEKWENGKISKLVY